MPAFLKTLVSFALLLTGIFSYGLAQTTTRGPHYVKAKEFLKAKNPEDALREARIAVGTSESPGEKARAILLLVTIQSRLKMDEAVMDSLNLGLSLPLEDYPLERALLLQNLAGLRMRRGEYAAAQEPLLEAIATAEAGGVKDSISGSYNKLGITYYFQGDDSNALLYFNKFLDILERNPDKEAMSMANVNVGTIHVKLGDYEQAKKNYRKAQAIELEDGRPEDLAAIYRSLSMVSTAKGDHEQAKLFLDSALVTPLGPDNEAGKAITLTSLVHAYENLGEMEKALSTMRKKIALNEPMANVKAMNAWMLAHLLDENDRQDSVELLYRQSMSIADSGKFSNTLQKARLNYFEWLKKQGRFEAALEVYEDFAQLKLELKKEESEKVLAQERARFEVLEAKSELKDATEENVVLEETNALYVGLLIALGLLFLAVLALLLLLQKARQKLKGQNKQLVELVATKNKFFSIIAHDIRSPLVAFQSIGKRIQKAHQDGNTDKVTFLSNQLDESATQLNGLLNNLLSWALLQNDLLNHRPQSLSAEEVILDNIDLFRDLAQMKHIDLAHELQDDLTVFADENALHLIVRNLLSNAIKFSPEGGRVSIHAFERDGKTVIEVRDTGPGIPKGKLKDIFSIQSGGERGTAGEKGVGLGLHLVSELMRVHKGLVSADAQEGKGSTFTLVFQN